MAWRKVIEQRGVEDLVLLPQISESAVVGNIQKRYDADLIYTYISDVLVSMNPYKWINGLYGPEQIINYKGRYMYEMPPHVYALADDMYRMLLNDRESQCVIISGESGAGKTEASKKIMEYIAAVTGESPEVKYVKEVVLQSNPLLEAFGNAKTTQNNNSSRFGKYLEILINPSGDPYSGRITNYLLEKSRVVFQAENERCFHVFYQLLAGLSAKEKESLGLTASASEFHYLNQGQAYTVDGINDQEEFAEMRAAMTAVGFSVQEQQQTFQLLAGILWLGNVTFAETDSGYSAVYDPQVSNFISSLFSVDPAILSGSLTQRTIETGSDGGRSSVVWTPLTVELAIYTRDALAKGLYSRLFDFVISKVNTALARSTGGVATYSQDELNIGILDIYGFEIFKRNGFEQLCINYVNEKLQQVFIELTLKKEQEEYMAEGIEWTPIDYFNNKVVCDLIEGKRPPGIFALLDDVSNFPKGTDQKFYQRLQQDLMNHEHLIFTSENNFTVRHYAGDVQYDVENFLDKNKDSMYNSLIDLMQRSSSELIQTLFPEQRSLADKKRPTTAGFKIKESIGQLMDRLLMCNPHYIRTIRPNARKKANTFDSAMVTHQVRYLGLLENVRVRRAGFCYRRPFQKFFHNFKVLSKKRWPKEWSGNMERDTAELIQAIMTANEIDRTEWQLGRSKVFLKHPETLFTLQEQRERALDRFAKVIQRSYLRHKNRREKLKLRQDAPQLLGGRKERRRQSLDREFLGDYCAYRDNFQMRKLIDAASGTGKREKAFFAEALLKYDRRFKAVKRTFIVTGTALYVVALEKDKDNPDKSKRERFIYVIKRRVTLQEISHVTLSPFTDNVFVVHTANPKDYDNLFESTRKVEIVVVIADVFRAATNRNLNVNIADVIQYKKKGGSFLQLRCRSDPSAQVPSVRSGTVIAPPGLPGNSQPKHIEPPQQQQRSTSSKPSPYGAPAAAASKPQCKALFAYEASDADELSFPKDAVIEVVSKDDANWWKGRYNGSVGLFPANYVEMMAAAPAPSKFAPPSAKPGGARPSPSFSTPPGGNSQARPAPVFNRPPPSQAGSPPPSSPPSSPPASRPPPPSAAVRVPPPSGPVSRPPPGGGVGAISATRAAQPGTNPTPGKLAGGPGGGIVIQRPGELPPFMKAKQQAARGYAANGEEN